MTVVPRNDKLTDIQRRVWEIIYCDLLNNPVKVSKFAHVTAANIADQIVCVLSNSKATPRRPR